MTRVLVTGVGGQDGHYLAQLLLAEGAEVHGVVRPGGAAPGGVIRHEADLAIPGSGAAVVATVRPHAVYNLAAVSSVARSWEDPALTQRINADLVAELLAAIAPTTVFVQASSAEIFGEPVETPQTERTPIAPVNPYGEAKAAAHRLARAAHASGRPVGTAILFSHESPLRPDVFVTRRITTAAVGMARDAGARLALGGLGMRRDWGWAPDAVRALRLIADRPDDYVIATGVSHSVEDFARTAFEYAGVADWRDRLDLDPALARPADAAAQVGDAAKARRELGWAPTRTFEQIVAAMVDADR